MIIAAPDSVQLPGDHYEPVALDPSTKPYVPPGAQEKTLEQQRAEEREALAQAQLAEQRQRVARIMAAKREMLGSPLGLRALFPTNKITVKIKHRAPSIETPASQLEEAALKAAK